MQPTVADEALGLLETHGLTPAMVAIDLMTKTAQVRVRQVELNDLYGVCIQIGGRTADVQAAIAAAQPVAEAMGGRAVGRVIPRVAAAAEPGIRSQQEFNPLIQQDVVFGGANSGANDPAVGSGLQPKDHAMKASQPSALGFLETQGFTAVLEALDTACKTANVTVVGKEKLGGGYVTVILEGELSAVRAAIDAGKAKVEGLGKLIAAHVIARPSEAVLSLLPRI